MTQAAEQKNALDAWAILEWLEGREPAASRIDAALKAQPVMSWINLGEVAYILERKSGRTRAQEVVRLLRRRLTLEVPSAQRILEAAALKASHAISYADAFAVATAIGRGCRLLTGDPEILTSGTKWPVQDVR